jgi:uncharacterized membrane protein HdeD (DUF308 family)
MKWKGIVMSKQIGIIAVGIALGVTLFFFGLLVLIWSFTIGSSIWVVLFGGFGCFQIFMGTIVVGMLFEERRREWIVVLGAIAISVTLLFFGFFFFLLGALSVFLGISSRPAGLEYLVMLFGGSILAPGIIIVLKLVEEKKRKWIITARVSSSATLFFVGSLFLICSFVLGSRIGDFLNPFSLLIDGFGGSMIAAGILVVLKLFEARERKWVVTAKIVSSAALIFFGLLFVTWLDLLGIIIGGPMIVAGIITILRTVR